MRLGVDRLLLPLLLLCYGCLARRGSETGDPNGIIKTTSPNEAMRSMPKVPFERSLNDFPCPDAEAIAPCVCTVDSDTKIQLNCTLVESAEQLETVFQQEFPVKDLYKFYMEQNSAVNLFSNFMNGVTFEILELQPGPFVLEGISDYFLLDLKDTLTEIWIVNSKLQTAFFPFYLLPEMKLQSLHLHGSDINWVPQIRPSNLILIGLDVAAVEILSQGTFAIGTGHTTFLLQDNQIHTIEPGSIFFADQNISDSSTIYIDLRFNQLATVNEEVFGDLMPFITTLKLADNPLTCECDIAWLVLNEAFLGVVDAEATCADGTNLHDLNPEDYSEFCRQ